MAKFGARMAEYLTRPCGLNSKAWQCIRIKVFGGMGDIANVLAGQVSGGHGNGFAKKGSMHQATGTVASKLLGNIKNAFYPKGLLNPGKVC